MKTTEQKQRILSKTLSRLKKKEHLPQELIYLLGQTAELQLAAHKEVSIELPFDMDLSGLSEMVAQGGSFLTPETLPLDRNHVFTMFSRIIELVTGKPENMPDTMVKAATAIKEGLKNKELDLEKAVDECLKGGGPITTSWAERTPEAPSALKFLILASLAPSINAGVELLAEKLDLVRLDDAIRHTGTCPVCGNLPHILELREKEGIRFAICSMCHHEYRIRRLACPVCDTSDTDKIKNFIVDDEPGFRVETCDTCKTYFKTIDFRSLDRKACPAFDDLESLALDYLAAEQGFSRPVQSVWGI